VNHTMYKKAQVKASKCSQMQLKKLVLGSLEVFLVSLYSSFRPEYLRLGSIPERDVKDGNVYNTCTVYNPNGVVLLLLLIMNYFALNKVYHRRISGYASKNPLV
jgi:hypothetical protein